MDKLVRSYCRDYLASRDPQDLLKCVKRLERSGQIEDVRDEIIESLARTFFVSNWGRAQHFAFSEQELMEIAPETPPAVLDLAAEYIKEAEQYWQLNLSSYYFLIDNLPHDEYYHRELTTEHFGHLIAMSAMDEGVGLWEVLPGSLRSFTQVPSVMNYAIRFFEIAEEYILTQQLEELQPYLEHEGHTVAELRQLLLEEVDPLQYSEAQQLETISYHPQPNWRLILEAANQLLGGAGVETIDLFDEEDDETQIAAYYVNVGDVYTTTLFFDLRRRYFLVSSYEDFITGHSAHRRNPYRCNMSDEPKPGSVFRDPTGDVFVAVKNYVIGYVDGDRLLLRPDKVVERYSLTPAELSAEQIAKIWGMTLPKLKRELGKEAYKTLIKSSATKPRSINALLAQQVVAGSITIEEAKRRSPNIHKLARALRRRGLVLDPTRTERRIKSNEAALLKYLPYIKEATNRNILVKRISEIAEKIGVEDRTVYKMLRRMGLDIIQDTLRERDKQIFELTRQGLSYREIAQRLDISITTIKDTFRRHGTSRFLVIRDGSPI